jgi:integrase/recombinase XerD
VEEPSVDVPGGQDPGSDGEEDDQQVIERLILAARSTATHKKYNSLWSQFVTFCVGKRVPYLPAASSSVLLFIAELHQSPSKISSVRVFITVIRQRHVEKSLPDPTASHLVAKAVEGALRIAAQSKEWPLERDPFPVEALRVWVARPPTLSEFLRSRNAALISLGLRAMLRAAEIVKIRLEDVHESNGGLSVRMRPSKADQNALRKPFFVDPSGLPTCPAALVRALIHMRRNQGAQESDLMFSDVSGRPLSPSAVSSIVKSVADHAGIEGNFSGHSLRIGGASAALAAGFTVDEVMALGAWKSDAVKQYLMPLVTRRRNVSRSFGL